MGQWSEKAKNYAESCIPCYHTSVCTAYRRRYADLYIYVCEIPTRKEESCKLRKDFLTTVILQYVTRVFALNNHVLKMSGTDIAAVRRTSAKAMSWKGSIYFIEVFTVH